MFLLHTNSGFVCTVRVFYVSTLCQTSLSRVVSSRLLRVVPSSPSRRKEFCQLSQPPLEWRSLHLFLRYPTFQLLIWNCLHLVAESVRTSLVTMIVTGPECRRLLPSASLRNVICEEGAALQLLLLGVARESSWYAEKHWDLVLLVLCHPPHVYLRQLDWRWFREK